MLIYGKVKFDCTGMYPPETLVRETEVMLAVVALAIDVVAGMEVFDAGTVGCATVVLDRIEDDVADDNTVDEVVVVEAVDVLVVVALALLIGKPEEGAAVGSSTQSHGSVP